MTPSEVARMANAIADYFRAYPEDEAEAGIADHIRQFWEPRMREALSAQLASGGEGLDPLALKGARLALGAPA